MQTNASILRPPQLGVVFYASVVLLGVILLGVNVLQAAPANPYQVIVDANAFRLRQPVAKPIEVPPPPPKPQVTARLTGLTSMFGHQTPEAFVEIQEAGKPGPRRVMLKAGEQSEGVELVSIDVRQGTATVRMAGVESLLTLARSEGAPVTPTTVAISTGILRR